MKLTNVSQPILRHIHLENVLSGKAANLSKKSSSSEAVSCRLAELATFIKSMLLAEAGILAQIKMAIMTTFMQTTFLDKI